MPDTKHCNGHSASQKLECKDSTTNFLLHGCLDLLADEMGILVLPFVVLFALFVLVTFVCESWFGPSANLLG